MTGLHSSTVIESLPQDNDAATWRTLEVMGQAVRGELPPDKVGWRDERIRRKALEIVSGVKGEAEQIEKLFLFVRDGIPYRRDQVDTQRVQDALQTLTLDSGKCVDKVILLASLLGSIGFVSRFVLQKPTAGADWAHVYLEVWDDAHQQWIALDPTGDGIGHPLAGVGWRSPAHQEATFDIFKGVGMPVGSYGQPAQGNWWDILSQGIETAGNVAGAHWGGPYYQSSWGSGYPLDAFGRPINPQTGTLVNAPVNTAAASVNPFGTQFNIPRWGWALVGVVAGSYLLGKGRR